MERAAPSPLLAMIKSNWAIITTTGFITAQILAIKLEYYKLKLFGIEFLSIAQLQDVPLILLRYPEMILFVIYGGVALYAYFELYTLIKNGERISWRIIHTSKGKNALILLLSGLAFCVMFWYKSEPIKEAYLINNKAFTKVVVFQQSTNFENKCFGYISSTISHLVLYDFVQRKAMTIRKSTVDTMHWTYLPELTFNKSKCSVGTGLYDKNEGTKKVVPL
ncbi:hypothetical protein AB6D05_15110 [Vibrio cyclitrophicus]